MTVRKYLSEFGLHMVATFRLLLQQDDLDTPPAVEALKSSRCHIYMVCRRPRITLDPASVTVSGERFTGRFLIQRGNTFEPRPFSTPNLTGHSSLVLECPYPHTRFRFLSPDGTLVSHGKVGMLAHYTPGMEEYLDLEVLYVGQAYGDDGSRTAPDRLRSHSTLQSIYAAALTDAPDQDIWLVLWEFEPLLITSFDGRTGIYGTTDEEDSDHARSVIQRPVSEQQRINFVEAALIRYFEPEYNKTFKFSFPNPAHGTYKECYDLDLNAVSVELTTDDIRTRLWSQSVAANWIHMPTFPLHSSEERRNMFALLDPNAIS
jgi:hypothetical protein